MNFKNVLLILSVTGCILCKPSNNCTSYYKVRKNENLLDISIKHKLPLPVLKYLNNDINEVKKDQSICIEGDIDLIKYSKKVNEISKFKEISKSQTKSLKNAINRIFDKDEIEELNKTSDFIASSFNKVFNDLVNFDITTCEKTCKNSQNLLKMINDNEYNSFSIDKINLILEKSLNGFKFDIDTLYDRCVSFCYNKSFINKAINDYNKENEHVNIEHGEEDIKENVEEDNEEEKLNKRASCPTPSPSSYSKVEDMSIAVYGNTKIDVLNRVDGCSAGILDYDLFKPACNAHDYCYHCNDKSYCDKNLLKQLQSLCDAKYSPSGFFDFIGEIFTKNLSNCLSLANVYYLGVDTFGSSGFDSDKKSMDSNPNKSCYCSASYKSAFVDKPFYK
ncbi:hypothetical protein PIROE2DRAFT_9675 [Piromyces sp. E2]|nr:hypothetical protein PIROE2DRAFT_9675 [Piromyces sp. E2]|eukprot:OUM63736.1 hypothetical protein PIROE2DRAFT_9675 [Piromyces sp. E2]